VVASHRPGEPASPPLLQGTCARVATGAPVPEGAELVVMREDVDDRGERALFCRPGAAGKHVIEVGEDVSAGEKLLEKGRRLRPQDLGVVASLEIAALLVVKRPRA